MLKHLRKAGLTALLLLGLAGCGEVSRGAPTIPPETVHVHEYTQTVIPPSCTEDGYTLHQCACGDSYTDQQIPMTGHSYTPVQWEANCLEGEGIRYTCACGNSYLEQTSPPLGHQYAVEEVVEPEGEARGYTLHRCVRCDNSYRDSFTWSPEAFADFFEDAVFVGDSITYKMIYHNAKYKSLGNATILARGGVSLTTLVDKDSSYKLYYRGKISELEDIMTKCGGKKLFVLLGVNDVPWLGVEKTIQKLDTLVNNVLEKNPDVEIYLQSCTPIYLKREKGNLTNARLDEYNVLLKEYALEKGYHYIDIATPMKNEENALRAEYCLDQSIHVNDAGCAVWINEIKSYLYEENLYEQSK